MAPQRSIRAVRDAGCLPLVPDAGNRQIGEHYEVRIAGKDRVAGYAADVIDVMPRDGFRYGYRLWLDHSTRLAAALDGHR